MIDPRILPNDCVVQRLAGGFVPKQRRLALVGDADGCELAGAQIAPRQRGTGDFIAVRLYLQRVMLHPAGFWKNLPMLLLCHRNDPAGFIEHDKPRARRSLIECADILHHGFNP